MLTACLGNIHYVGTSGISSFLITAPEGHILAGGCKHALIFSPVRGGIFVEPVKTDFQAPSGATSSGICRS